MSDAGEGEVGFEELYAQAGENLEAVPWALLAPHPALVSWLERQPNPEGETALVTGCGFGDDAECLEQPLPAGRGRTFTVVYQRPPAAKRES